MKLNLKSILFSAFVVGSISFGNSVIAQTSCQSSENKEEMSNTKDCETDAKLGTTYAETTSGCSPSGCRGAKTKFGEAKVISSLRLDLIALKADMEKSIKPIFDKRSYDIHGIVGESDEESIKIIAREVRIVEKAFSEKLNYKIVDLKLPKNKAKQVVCLSERIRSLKRELL